MSFIVRQPVYYPVSAVFVDDSIDFLHALRGLLPNASMHRFYADPHEALAKVSLQTQRQRPAGPLSGRSWSEFEKHGGNALGDDLMTDAGRYEGIAALVVDYEMPGLDGIEFLAAVPELDCAKILLTGTADESHAVEAFNAGLIDFYLKKTDPAMARKLSRVLAEAKQKHCARRGPIGVHGVGTIYTARDTLEELGRVVVRERIIEYYWRPEQNAVLTLDLDGKAGVFVAWDTRDWAAQCDVVADEDGPRELREAMLARAALPVFWPHEAYRAGLRDLKIVTPTPIPGLDDAHYGWTLLDRWEPEPGWVTCADLNIGR